MTENVYFLWQMVQQHYQEETTNSKIPFWDWNPPQRERETQRRIFKAIGKSFNLKKQKIAGNSGRLLVCSKRFDLSSSYWTESSIIRAKRRVIPHSTEIHWCHQVNSHRFGCSTRKTNWWPLVVGNRNLSDTWTGFTRFTLLNEAPPKEYMWSGRETDRNPNDITSRSRMAWRLDKNWKSRSEKRKTRMGNRETKTRTRKKIDRSLFYWSEWRRIYRHHKECKAKVGVVKGSCNTIKKSVSSSMHTGNRFFKNRNSQGIWSRDQIQLYYWSPWISKTKNEVSNEKGSWRTHRGKRTEFCGALQF